MREAETFSVKDETYSVNMWHPDRAMEELAWLIKMLGESVVSFVVQADSISDLMDKDIDASFLVPAVRNLVLNIKEKEIAARIKSYTSDIIHGTKPVDYGNHFAGQPGHLILVVAKVLRIQYADFFDVLPELKKGD